MDELLDQFIVEGRDLVAQAQRALADLGRDARSRAAVDQLFRAVHTLKGSVALFDMQDAERLLHEAETHLDEARKRQFDLSADILEAMVEIIDQTDRWIDDMERHGALGADAGSRTATLTDRLKADQRALIVDSDLHAGPSAGERPSWLADMLERPRFRHLAANASGTAFRYMPDADCFFRGEDPLAFAAAIPDLKALAIVPSEGSWPDLEKVDPFRCASIIEGISSAGPAAVRAAFRLVPDQVLVASLGEDRVEAPAMPIMAADGDRAAATLRVEAATLDRLARESGELGIAIRAIQPLLDRAEKLDLDLSRDLRTARDELNRVAANIGQAVAKARLVSLESALRRLPRLSREAASTAGKQVRFVMEGETTKADKNVADLLFEPLLHLVRNAIDHGIEAPAERLDAGKPVEGRVELRIETDGDRLCITLSDDGRGIDADRIREAAIARELVEPGAARALGPEEVYRLLFLPGFSTAGKVTSLSGRGVGLDAVQSVVERLRGTIRIESLLGQGSKFVIQMPLHAITARLMVVSAGGERFGIRLDQVVETARIPVEEIREVGQGLVCVLRDRTVPVFDLGQLLGLEANTDAFARLVLINVQNSLTALRVARFEERFDAALQTSSGLLARLPAVEATTRLADGDVLIVLNLAELLA